MATVLITGCDRGLGEEFALQYAAVGQRVLATCLEPAEFSGKHARQPNIEAVGLDITDHAAVLALADRLGGAAIDILINNVGLAGPQDTRPMRSASCTSIRHGIG